MKRRDKPAINDLCLHCTRETCNGICDALRAANGPLRISKRGKRITWNGCTRSVHEWAEIMNVSPNTLYRRLRDGMPLEDVMTRAVVRRLDRCPPEWREKTCAMLARMHIDYLLYWDRPTGLQDSAGMVTRYEPSESAPTNRTVSLTEMRALPETMLSDDILEKRAWIRCAMELAGKYRVRGPEIRYEILQLRAFEGCTLRRIVDRLNDERLRAVGITKTRHELNNVIDDLTSLADERGLFRVAQK